MEVEWLILADYAEAIGDKLYLMGGGWDVLQIQSTFPVRQKFAIAVAFHVPWDETNQRQPFSLEILTEAGEPLGVTLQGQVEAGRPPGIPPGTSQRVQLAVNLELQLEKPGGYVIEVKMGETIMKRASFFVIKI